MCSVSVRELVVTIVTDTLYHFPEVAHNVFYLAKRCFHPCIFHKIVSESVQDKEYLFGCLSCDHGSSLLVYVSSALPMRAKFSLNTLHYFPPCVCIFSFCFS